MKRLLVFVLLVAAVAVPLAHAGDPAGSGTTPVETSEPPSTDPGPAPGPDPEPTFLPDGVTVGGIPVGGMTVEQAKETLEAAFAQPLHFAWAGTRWAASPARLGARAYVDGALRRAAIAPPGAEIDLVVTVRGTTVREYVDKLARRFNRQPRNATLRLVKLRPSISEARPGVAIEKNPTVASIVAALKHGERGPLKLHAQVLKASITARNFGPVIVIRRGSRSLYLYRGESFVRKLGVAVGQPSFPTPLGRFKIVVMQRNPWWYPPPSPWAKDEKPVPPGPGNPLGTRWMGLSAPFVGIHGTPDAASIGYSASHGCIRMHIPEAEWLYERVRVGTTVFIVAA